MKLTLCTCGAGPDGVGATGGGITITIGGSRGRGPPPHGAPPKIGPPHHGGPPRIGLTPHGGSPRIGATMMGFTTMMMGCSPGKIMGGPSIGGTPGGGNSGGGSGRIGGPGSGGYPPSSGGGGGSGLPVFGSSPSPFVGSQR